jgi:putative transposase
MTADDVEAMRPRRLEWLYKRYPIFYLTLVAHDRRYLFANAQVHQAFISFSEVAMQHGVAVGRYVLMPDHIHLFAGFGDSAPNLSNWVKSLKNSLSKYLRRQGVSSPHWQKDFFDHVLRSEESYREKWEYMRRNPERAGLVTNADDWEFQGEIYELGGSLFE